MTPSAADLRGMRRRRRGSRGFTLIELVVVIVIASVLGAVALDKLLFYTERAEKAAMDATLASIKMGLQIRLAEMIIANRQMAATELEHENPMHWLAEPPGSYLGEYRAPPKPGNWYFATTARQLVYVPNNTSYFLTNQGEAKELRFQVKLKYDELEFAGSKVRSLTGITLLPIKPYRWF